MPNIDDEHLLQRLLGIFRIEAAEHLKAMAGLLSTLEAPAAASDIPALIEALFREAHSLKGAARSVNLSQIEAVCKGLEDELSGLKRRPPASLPPAWFKAIYRSLDTLDTLLADSPGEPTPTPTPPPAAAPSPAAKPEKAPPPPSASGDTVRISSSRLAALLVEAEALLAFKFGTSHVADELHAVADEVARRRKAMARAAREARALRRRHGRRAAGDAGARTASTIEKLLDIVDHDDPLLKTLGDRLSALAQRAERESRALAGSVDTLQAELRIALMLPFASLLEVMPKLVRDLARDSGKDIELRIDGAELEIDRRILEQLKDPLIHLVRNAVDHGIESPAERHRAGKASRGRIAIDIQPLEGSRVELLVADDGAGIDPAQIANSAAKLGLIAPEEVATVSHQAALSLMFASGLSTSPILTNLSGRGLGLAIVREKVEKLSGSIVAELPDGGGTRFRIVLPSMLATFRGVLVGVGEQQFVLPSRNVERVQRVAVDSIKTVENREAIEIDGLAVALVRLADVLGLPADTADDGRLPLVVLSAAGQRIAFAVDAVLGDQEVLVKGLGPQLRRVANFSGATVLGSGRLVPIIDVADLMKSAPRAAAKSSTPSAPPPRQHSLLVVEDSITARILLKSILESAGYRVDTAVDGIDALTALRTGAYDLVVSDVEMPRMDGFSLTESIRQDKKLADTPVILVTALESREDRERGVEAGANAYIVKSSFDQSDLFEAIRRLI
ncbi:hybrid sensor histidine kinase/response regulator [Denitromonas iodatirespirans]|uniref:Chemotaxis protein CheA n=1 Tax=Denitromonas iodatirespirans TaxID=2795389 RepID=A0A944D426_DENI1|nr:response regulator [Denitromonas iodatirespirans]MBT0959564.1 response regulator [Denitromonas iodatirespirans]